MASIDGLALCAPSGTPHKAEDAPPRWGTCSVGIEAKSFTAQCSALLRRGFEGVGLMRCHRCIKRKQWTLRHCSVKCEVACMAVAFRLANRCWQSTRMESRFLPTLTADTPRRAKQAQSVRANIATQYLKQKTDCIGPMTRWSVPVTSGVPQGCGRWMGPSAF